MNLNLRSPIDMMVRPWTGESATRRFWAALAATVVVAAVVPLAAASVAHGAFADDFGVAPIGPDAPDNPPALADLDLEHAFWAGTCRRASAPAPPAVGDPPVAIPGGVGAIPSQVFAPNILRLLAPVPAPTVPEHCIDMGKLTFYTNPKIWEAGEEPRWRLPAVTQAGAHPDGTTTFAFARDAAGGVDGSVDNIYVDLPPGFVANPNAVSKCTAEQFAAYPLDCPPSTQIGVIRFQAESIFHASNLGSSSEHVYPLYNLEPRKGHAAEIGFGHVIDNYTTVRLVGKARTNGDFGVTAFTGQIPAALPPIMQTVTLWGVPWAAHNDEWRLGEDVDPTVLDPCRINAGGGRGFIMRGGQAPECSASYDPSWGDSPDERSVRAFISNETDCNPAPVVGLAVDSYQYPGAFTAEEDPDLSDPDWKTYESVSPAVTGCEKLGFEPDISFDATTRNADGASGLDVELDIPQNNDPKAPGGGPLDPPAPGASDAEIDAYVEQATDFWSSDEGLATAHLKDTVVTLPEGMAVNPSAAAGLRGCSDAQIGLRQLGDPPLFNNGDPFDGAGPVECPPGSVIGTARVETPLLDDPLTGEVVLGQPKSTDPTSGEMLRLFIVVRDRERGLLAKIYGSSVADPATGQLTTTFSNNPELPFDRLRLRIQGGHQGLLRTPQRCGTANWGASFTPWSSVGAPVPVPDVPDGGAMPIDANCAFNFFPDLTAGMDTRQAGESGTFSFEFTRRDGEQWFKGLTARLPQGLLASVKHVELCTDAEAEANACPLESQVGVVDAAAGSGTPFVLERKGRVYLTEGYKGAPYGLAVSVPVEAGPFRGPLALTPIVVRQALHVDRRTAQVTAVSDPLPTIWHGIPLAVRRVTVTMDRNQFMRNPTDCSQKQILASFESANGASHDAANLFYAAECAEVPFRPKLQLRLRGRRQVTTGRHPALRAVVTQRGDQAGIKHARVALPKTLALDPDNAQALCEFEDGTKPDLENHCSEGSIVGRARAVSPLLKRPLTGDVYFVKNIRIDPDTGNEIRTLPMLVVALRGEIALNLRGESNVSKSGKLVNTFAAVPDAPVSRFAMNVRGGRNGILTVTRTERGTINLCKLRARRHLAVTRIRGHNNKLHPPRVRVRTPCGKRGPAAKRRQAAKRRRAAKQRRANAGRRGAGGQRG